MREAKSGSAGAFMRTLKPTLRLRKRQPRSAAFQLLAHPLLEGLDLGQLRLYVGALLLEARLVRLEHREEALELRPLVAPRLVHVDQLADLREREPQALAAQRELEPRAGGPGGDGPLAFR